MAAADLPPIVVTLIAVRQPGNLFRIELLILYRNDGLIGDHVIDTVRAHRSGIRQILCLHRRAAIDEYRRPALIGIALEINGDIDLPLAQHSRDFVIRSIAHLDELTERAHHTLTNFTAVIFGPRDRYRLES